jgi:hypothetical protein
MKPVFDQHFIFFASSLEALLAKEKTGVNKISTQDWIQHQKEQLRIFIKTAAKDLSVR